MPDKIFVNLPVTNLSASRRFYEGLGFSINEDFSDETAASVVISESIFVMLLTHEKYQDFTDLPIGDAKSQSQHLLALACESRTEVDDMAAKALAHGGSEHRPAQDYGFMYARAISDPDGHTWEPFWMDPAASGGATDTA